MSLGGIKILTLVSRAAAAGNYLLHAATGVTSKITMGDFADWILRSSNTKFFLTTHQDTNYTTGDGSVDGCVKIYSQITAAHDIVLAGIGAADIHVGNVAGGTGVFFIDTNIKVAPWGNGTRGHGLQVTQADNSVVFEFPSSGGIMEVVGTLRGANGANLDTIFRSGGTSALWKFSNSANTVNVLTVSNVGLITLRDTTGATALTVSPDTDVPRIKGGGSASGMIFYGTQGSAGTAGFFRFNNNGTDDQTLFEVVGTAAVSVVNKARMIGGATGVGPVLSAQGETNVDITVTSKAAGNVILSPNTGDIKWNKALVAMGGGAAPTLGTIGGSGPTVAGQNTWMRVLDSTGAAFWVPAWK